MRVWFGCVRSGGRTSTGARVTSSGSESWAPQRPCSKRPLFGKRSAAGSRLSGRAERPRPWEGASGSAAGTGAGTGAALPRRGAATARELVGAPCPELLVSAARRYCPTRGRAAVGIGGGFNLKLERCSSWLRRKSYFSPGRSRACRLPLRFNLQGLN